MTRRMITVQKHIARRNCIFNVPVLHMQNCAEHHTQASGKADVHHETPGSRYSVARKNRWVPEIGEVWWCQAFGWRDRLPDNEGITDRVGVSNWRRSW